MSTEHVRGKSTIVARSYLALRILAIVAGGYFLTGGITGLIGLSLHSMGLSLRDGMLWSVMFGFLLYVGIVMWGFAAPPRHRPAATICGLALFMCAAVSVLLPTEIL